MAVLRSCTPAPLPPPVSKTVGVSLPGLPTDLAPLQTFQNLVGRRVSVAD
jgi:hypothetical protein